MSPLVSKRLRIHGLVQGVGYRQAMAHQASALGVDGWVRNLSDGSVEALVSGPPSAVDQIIAWAHQGPHFAQVTHVSVREADAPTQSGFHIAPSA